MRAARGFGLGVLLGCAAALWARDVEIVVFDADLDLPLEGAVIRSWDGQDYTCDEEGRLVLEVPDGRQVTVQATYPGYETGRAVVPLSAESVRLALRLGGMMESRELVIEAERPDTSETKSGRSVAVSGETLERSSRIGVIEDVMQSIKLLPGVGYTGMFGAQPSIRGGDPGDLMASYDGFYLENPYYWGGSVSIFDPNMVESARLSHGIFSPRYGHTISGLLEVTSKSASPAMAEAELGVSTSAANLSVSLPFSGRGGLRLMARTTYWDPFIALAQGLSRVIEYEPLDMVNAITTSPYIRSLAATFNYRFSGDLEARGSAFLGVDGVGMNYGNDYADTQEGISYQNHMAFDWDNLQAFATGGLVWNPRADMVLKSTLGAGLSASRINGGITYDYLKARYTDEFVAKFGALYGVSAGEYEIPGEYLGTTIDSTDSGVNVQARVDYDWDLGRGLLFAAGAQELFSKSTSEMSGRFMVERETNGVYLHFPLMLESETSNSLYNSALYALLEYAAAPQKFGAEAGLRVDHLYFSGDGFNLNTRPALNPRLNLDYNLFKDRGAVDSLDLTAGTGLFSSVNDNISGISAESGLEDFELKPNRSWTSVLGVRADVLGAWSFNLEGYYKYVFDRQYTYAVVEPGKNSETVYRFNGDGKVAGFDLQLQKLESEFIDGWISYTFTWARYRNRDNQDNADWYYPGFHRFHNLNLVLNIKPRRNFNIYFRFGAASGRLTSERTGKEVYAVMLVDDAGKPTGQVIEKWKALYAPEQIRSAWVLPCDLKLSWYYFSPSRKTKTEMYLAIEYSNMMNFFAQSSSTSFNEYTGTEDQGSQTASYSVPIPLPSFGFRWSY